MKSKGSCPLARGRPPHLHSSTWQLVAVGCYCTQSLPVDCTVAGASRRLQKKRRFPLKSSYVCPEPVLANRSFLYECGSGIFRT